VTWFDWMRVIAVLLVIGAVIVMALAALIWLCTAPLGSGPERIVDVENRGHTRIRMPDGTIK